MAADGTPMTAEILEIVHDALNLHPGTAEIQKKADGKSRSAEVVDALGSRSLFQVDLRFQLDQYARFNKQVSHVRADDFSLVPDVQRPLLFDGEAASPQLHAQSILVDLLEEAHAKYMAYTLPCPANFWRSPLSVTLSRHSTAVRSS